MILIPILFTALASYLIISDTGAEVKPTTEHYYHVGTADRSK